jgi:adenylate kinase family enzyme
MILGGPGSGKSTMARWMSEQTGLPVRHLDHVHWMPHWTPRPSAQRLAMVRAYEQEERWIIEGGLSETHPSRMARADVLVWIDLPVSLRLWRVLRRSIRYRGRGRPDLPDGCIERFDRDTAAFILWIWQDREKGRQRILKNLGSAPGHLAVHHLRSSREVAAFKRGLRTP